MKGWVGVGTTIVSKQSAQDRYVMEITAISCSDHHASRGNWKRSRLWASNSGATTSLAESHDANHYATESPEAVNRLSVTAESSQGLYDGMRLAGPDADLWPRSDVVDEIRGRPSRPRGASDDDKSRHTDVIGWRLTAPPPAASAQWRHWWRHAPPHGSHWNESCYRSWTSIEYRCRQLLPSVWPDCNLGRT